MVTVPNQPWQDLISASTTHVGMVRQNNEDWTWSAPTQGMFVVCDGMGGHHAGEVASRLCCEVIGQALQQHQDAQHLALLDTVSLPQRQQHAAMLTAAFQQANAAVLQQANHNSMHAGMGTTCTALWLFGRHHAAVGHVGDSRLYLLRNHWVHRLSNDHTYVADLSRRGAIEPQQASNHLYSHVLSQALGVQPEIAVDSWWFDVDAQDTFLLCSDGVHNYFPDPQELGSLMQGEDVAQAAAAIVAKALARGGHDNATALVLRVPQPTPAPPAPRFSAEAQLAALGDVPLFDRLSYVERMMLLGSMDIVHYPCGSTVVAAGTADNGFMLLLRGRLDLYQQQSLLGSLHGGAHLGEMALLQPIHRSVTVLAGIDSVVCQLQRQYFLPLLQRLPECASKILWRCSQLLHERLPQADQPPSGSDFDLMWQLH